MSPWNVQIGKDFDAWFAELPPATQDRVVALIEVLEESGPRFGLGGATIRPGEAGCRTIDIDGTGVMVCFRMDPLTDVIALTSGRGLIEPDRLPTIPPSSLVWAELDARVQ